MPWQLPTYDGTKSYQNLLVEVYGMTGADLNGSHVSTIIQEKPTNFIRSGYYTYNSGGVNGHSDYGRYWWSITNGTSGAVALRFYLTYLNLQYGTSKGFGFSLRCLAR